MSTATKSEGPVTIKKYANRRLYNTGTSTYVTLEDLAAMVKKGEDFVVYDAKTGEDITRSVLTQIIFEQENKEGGQNLLPIAPLEEQVRRNMEMFERAFGLFAPFARREASGADPDKPPSEIDELKRRLNDMQKRLDGLIAG